MDPDWFALKGLGDVLGGSGASRLQNSLVKTAGVATTATVGVEASAGPNLLIVQVLVAPGKDPAQAERMVYEEIDRVARDGVPKEEVERVETDYLRKRTFALVTTAARAQVFDEFLTIYGGLEAVNGWEKRVRRIGGDDLKRVARKYLTAANRTVMIVNPEGKP
ncbi:MAG: insulinase family protein [Bryobacteraceae bacterium]|jgi:zinc protease